MDFSFDVVLILRPLNRFGIVTASLNRVPSLSRYMSVEGKVRRESISSGDERLQELGTLCEELTADSLYCRYANKKVYRHADDFWSTKETVVRQHVKQKADRRLVRTVRLSASLDIPILYAPTEKSPLHITDRLGGSKHRWKSGG